MGFRASKYLFYWWDSPPLHGYIIICLTNVLFLGLSWLSHTALCPQWLSIHFVREVCNVYRNCICMPILPGMKSKQWYFGRACWGVGWVSLTCSTVLPLNKDLDEDRLHPRHQCGSPSSPALFIFANLVGEPLSRSRLSSMSVSYLPWDPCSGCRNAGWTNVGWSCPDGTQPAGRGGRQKRRNERKLQHRVCVHNHHRAESHTADSELIFKISLHHQTYWCYA